MSHFARYLLSVILITALAVGGLTASTGLFDDFKVAYREARWDLKYNNALDAISGQVAGALNRLVALSDFITAWAPTENQDILIPVAATYTDADTFTLPGDYTAQFVANARVRVDLGSGVLKGSYVASSSYGGGVTTVNIHDAVLTNPIGGVWVTATRNGLFPYGPGYVVARDYGTPGRQALADAISAIGANNRTLVGTPGAWAIDSDLTFPANVQFEPQNGFDLQVGTGVTVTFNGPVSAGLYKWITCTGTAKVVFGVGSVKEVFPGWWTENTTPGTTDMTAAVAAATNAAANRVPVIFTEDVKITDLLGITVDGYTWKGLRPERGCNAIGQMPTYSAVEIIYRPVDTTKFLVSKYSGDAPYTEILGPFIHENLTVDLGDANGFEFGREALGVTNQKYIFGVQFKNCAFHTTNAVYTYNADGSFVTPPSGRKMAWLTRAFETVFDSNSMYGGDVQIRTFGCDSPDFRGKHRSQGSHLPFDFNGSGSYTVQHTIESAEIEQYSFTPIKSRDVKLAVSNLSYECNIGTVTGQGIFTLPGITVAVTENSNSLTFSASMDGILFPGLSIIRLHNGAIGSATEYIDLLVATVSGTTVTVYANAPAASDSYSTTIPWSNAAAPVQRIHGYGPLHFSGFDANFSNVSCNPYISAPSFVYVAERGSMHIGQAGYQKGSGSFPSAIVLGNRFKETSYMNGQLIFSGATPLLVGDGGNPFVSCSNWGESNQATTFADSAIRSPQTNPFEGLSKIRRTWVFTPKSGSSATSNAHRTVMRRLEGDIFQNTLLSTPERVWAWHIRAGETLRLIDNTIPTRVTWFKVQLRGRSVSGGAAVTINTIGSATAAITPAPVFSGGWSTWEWIFQTPAGWLNSASERGFTITTTGIYVAGVMMQELVGEDANSIPGGTAAPAADTYYEGQRVWRIPKVSGQPAGWHTLLGGTFSAASEAGTAAAGSPIITGLTVTSDFYPGQIVSDVGGATRFPGRSKIVAKTATTITLNALATLDGAVTVETPDATFGAMPNLP